jgi:hypothetical protein
MMTCIICGDKLNTRARGVGQRVTGWAMNRKAGGANYIKERKEMGEWAHEPCIDGEKYTVNQMTMDELLEGKT